MKFLLPASVAVSIFFAIGLANKIFIFFGYPLFFTIRTDFSTSMYFYFFTSSFLIKSIKHLINLVFLKTKKGMLFS